MTILHHNNKFVIWASRYNERIGGVLVLHYLCHYLNNNGYRAFIWYDKNELYSEQGKWLVKPKLSYIKRKLRRKIKGIKVTSPLLNTPVASKRDLDNAIVIYPEVVNGNPLQASHVVRYLLHKPGFHTGRFEYGKNELYFYYHKAFDNPTLSSRPTKALNFPIILGDIFKQTNFKKRNGTCYILRKGKNRPISHDLADSVIVDNLSHADMAKVFNSSEYCISYDTQTFYTFYASICGCKVIVIPEDGVSKKEWRPEEGLRYGIAYGEKDMEWASNTRGKLLDFLKAEKNITNSKVRSFAEDCIHFFETEGSDV